MADRTGAARVRRYRRRMSRGLGLARVEVLVPHEQAAHVRAYAASLRDAAVARAKVNKLLDRAVREFGPRCLWNVDVSQRDEVTRAIIVARLRKHGGHDGWRLAMEIDELAHKAGPRT